jgi:ubiquinone/menaquinone biosynthesis C-methylase UbiE
MTSDREADTSHYLMEHAGEGARLEDKTNPEDTIFQLRLAGLTSGATCVDAGAGTGAVARVMADIVGPEGFVHALDTSAARITEGTELATGHDNLTFVNGDILSPPLQAESFDFVWCRFVLQHLAEPEPAVRSLVNLVRPGGKLVLGDLDGHGLRHHPMTTRMAAHLSRLNEALRGHQDPHMGRKLYHLAYRAGLSDLHVHVLPYHVYAGAAPERALANWTKKLEVAKPHMLSAFGSSAEFDSFASEFLEMLSDPGVFTYSSLILLVGTKCDEPNSAPNRSD